MKFIDNFEMKNITLEYNKFFKNRIDFRFDIENQYFILVHKKIDNKWFPIEVIHDSYHTCVLCFHHFSRDKRCGFLSDLKTEIHNELKKRPSIRLRWLKYKNL